MSDQDAVFKAFQSFDEAGDGTLAKDELKKLIQILDVGFWTDDMLDMLFKASEVPGGRIKYEAFVEWLFREDGDGPRSPKNRALASWGEWMGAWKAEAGEVDEEADRLSRAHAAFGGETLARMKDINVLILGCRGVGVEAAKNLILSNVGSVTVWDPEPASMEDLGTNFYLNADSVGKPRASQCLAQLKSLNPYCKTDVLNVNDTLLPNSLTCADVLNTGRGYSVIVATKLLPQDLLFKLNDVARSNHIAFVFAANMGVTTCFFSDFGSKHQITDEDGEPTQMLAVSAAEVIPAEGIVKVSGCEAGEKVLVLTMASDHGLADGDIVSLDDMRGDLSAYNGKQFKVKRFAVLSPSDAKVDLADVGTKEMLKGSTVEVLANFAKQHDFYKAEWEKAGSDGKFRVREITLFNRLCLVLGEGHAVSDWDQYRSGGLVNSVKTVIVKEYESLEKTLTYTPCPQMMDQMAWQNGDGCWVHLGIATALRWQAEIGSWPNLRDEAHADKFVQMAMTLSDERKDLEGSCWLQKIEWGFPSGEPAENIAQIRGNLKRFCLCLNAELTGFCAFLGGVIAQEVIKKTGKFTPVEQWIHHDDAVLFAETGEAGAFRGSRYEHQAIICGTDFMDRMRRQNIFLVGCGALGCEYLKGLALMGASTADGSKVIVTDMDRIEVSNLSRQFLFRQSDVGNPKSTSAARVVKGWNPELKIEALEKGVGVTSEDFFDDKFWGSIDLCWNALDNVVARKYTDRCCLWYGLPLLESGTLGTKSNSDVFLPKLTKSYNDGTESDANETQIAMCTLRSFPYLPLHCIEFAKQSYFSDYMEFAPQQYEALRKDPASFFEQLEAMSDAEQFKALRMIKGFIELQGSRKVDFEVCVRAAFKLYHQDFIFSIRDLVYHCDELEKSTGKPFWTGTKRKPTEAKWDAICPPAEALEYLYATANCYAFIWKVPYMRNRMEFTRLVVALQLELPEWSLPGADSKVADEDDDGDKADPAAIEALKGELYAIDASSLQTCEAHDFEKDDDTNFHIDFLTVATNLRAANYDIKLSERSHVKVTAGRIIPALATTTAMICGLVDMEFMKLVKGLDKGDNPLESFYNANVNLATGSQAMNMFRPEASIKLKSNLQSMPEYTSWDKIDITAEPSCKTVRDLVEHIASKYECKVKRLYPKGNDKICLYDENEVAKLDWMVELREGKLVAEPEAVFNAWPNLRMAKQMLEKLPEGGARTNFENQVSAAAKSLQATKDTFESRFNGLVVDAFVQMARPPDSEADKQQYFDTVHAGSSYVGLQVHVLNSVGEEAELPHIKYTYR